jgi:hypothetical protein
VLKINGEDTSVISPTLGFNIKTIQYQKYVLYALFVYQVKDGWTKTIVSADVIFDHSNSEMPLVLGEIAY